MTPPLPDTALLDEIERRPMEPGKAPVISRDEIKQLIATARAGLRVPALEDEIQRQRAELNGHLAAFAVIADQRRGETAEVGELKRVVFAAGQALKSYRYGNASTELAEEIAAVCDAALNPKDPAQ